MLAVERNGPVRAVPVASDKIAEPSPIQAGHEVLIEENAGNGSGFYNDQYSRAGATIVKNADDVWNADMVIKVKEPIQSEYKYLRPGLLLFTYLHLAADKKLTERLLESKTTSIAYETIQIEKQLPLLQPMSEIAGRMSSIVGAHYLSKVRDGSGILLCGSAGVLPVIMQLE